MSPARLPTPHVPIQCHDVAGPAISLGTNPSTTSKSPIRTPMHAFSSTTMLSSGLMSSQVLPHVLRPIVFDQLIVAKEGRKSLCVFNTTDMVQLLAELMKEAMTTLPLKDARRTVIYEMHSHRTRNTVQGCLLRFGTISLPRCSSLRTS